MTSDRSDPFLAEIHFIIAKFLEQGPFQDLAQEFIARATSSHALPSTVNWKGDQRALTWQQLVSLFFLYTIRQGETMRMASCFHS